MLREIENLIADAAREVADQVGETLLEELGRDSPLFGRDGIFDSVGLVTLIVTVEEGIAQRFGREVTLADEQALSQSRSPFRTIGTLAEYVHGLLGEAES